MLNLVTTSNFRETPSTAAEFLAHLQYNLPFVQPLLQLLIGWTWMEAAHLASLAAIRQMQRGPKSTIILSQSAEVHLDRAVFSCRTCVLPMCITTVLTYRFSIRTKFTWHKFRMTATDCAFKTTAL